MSAETRAIVERFWETMQTNDWAAVGELLHDEYLLELPQSGERLRGRANFAAFNTLYPAAGRWRFSVQRLLAEGDTAVSDVLVTDGAVQARVISFSVVRDGRIVQQTEFWPNPFEAPDWRAALVERVL